MRLALLISRGKIMRKWRRINVALAIIVLILSIVAAGKLGFTLWAEHAVQPQKTVVGMPTRQAAPTSRKLTLGDFSYQRSVDFQDQPTLVVTYQLTNSGEDPALPQYVFDSNVNFLQQTATGTTSVLASTEVAKGKLNFLAQNYHENGAILLRGGEKVKVVNAYRLESLNRPVTLTVRGDKRLVINPWTLKEVVVDD